MLTSIRTISCVLLAISAGAGAETITVPGDFPTIQDAIGAASNGDEVVVSPGTYSEQVNTGGKAITVRSTDGAQFTSIDGGSKRRGLKINSGESWDTHIEGFTIRFCDTGGHGGGALISGASPTIRQCIFLANDAVKSGGGAAVRSGAAPFFDDCIFLGNEANRLGGGVWVEASSPTFSGCEFVNNKVIWQFGETVEAAGYRGGGVACSAGSTATITNCSLRDNSSNNGGAGLYNESSDTIVADTRFDGNRCIDEAGVTSDGSGAGAHDTGGSQSSYTISVFTDNETHDEGAGYFAGAGSNTMFTDCSFENNVATGLFSHGGGAMVSDSNPTFSLCTFDANEAAYGAAVAMATSSDPEFTACSFLYNAAVKRGGALRIRSGSSPSFEGSRFQNNDAGEIGGAVHVASNANILLTDVLFCENTPDDLVGPSTDGGDNRYWVSCCEGDLDGNNEVDVADVLELLILFGPCDDCIADMDGSGTVDVTDLIAIIAAWGPCE